MYDFIYSKKEYSHKTKSLQQSSKFVKYRPQCITWMDTI